KKPAAGWGVLETSPTATPACPCWRGRLSTGLDPARRRLADGCAERLLKHPLPRIELEDQRDRTIVEIDEGAVIAQSDILDVEQGGGQASLAGRVRQIGQRSRILGAFSHSRQMQMGSRAEPLPGVDQALVNRIELIGARRND